LGANQDAILEASKIGIGEGHAINYSETKEECEAVYRSLGNVVNRQKSRVPTEFTQVERSQSYQPSTPPPTNHSNEPPPLRRQTSIRPAFF
jgi:hypothetical protein